MDLKFTITQQVPTSGEISIGAVQSELPTPHNSLNVMTYHDNYPANVDDTVYAASATGIPIVGYVSEEGPRDYQIVVTDKVMYADDVTRTTLLLSYQYQLRYDHYELAANPSGSINICYMNGDVVPTAKYRVEYTEPVFWEDYRDNGAGMTNRYDRGLTWTEVPPGTGLHRVRLLLSEELCYTATTYYVRYNKARKVSTGAAINSKEDVTVEYMEIINPKLIYEHTDDYTFNGGDNSISIVAAGLLPTDGAGAYIKRSHVNRLRVVTPAGGDREGWYPRIWAGSFQDASGNTYYVPETTKHQPAAVNWGGGGAIIVPRCSFMSYDEATILDQYHVKVMEYPLHFTTTNYPEYSPHGIHDGHHHTELVDLEVNPNYGMNVYINDEIIASGTISDWDLWNGIIELDRPLNYNDNVRVTYLYQQLYYTMQLPDTCPQVHHVKPGPPGCTPSGYLGMGDSIVIAALPSGDEHYADQLITWYHRSNNPSGIYDGSYYGYSSVIGDVLVANPDVPLVANTITLAEISVVTQSPEAATSIYDSRVRGGGIFEDSYFEVRRIEGTDRVTIQEESNYYADIGLYDGQGLKKDGVLIVTIPIAKLAEIRVAILDEIYGITEAEAHHQAIVAVRKLVESNIATGTYYVIVDENGDIWPSTLPGR